MTNHVKELLSQFSGQMAIVTIPAIYIRFTGSMESAALLSQILYWSDRTKDPDGWFHKSYSEWESEIALSEYQVRKHTKKFTEQGFLQIKLRKINGAPKVHYRVNWDVFSESILKFLRNGNQRNFGNLDSEKTSESIPKKLRKPINKDPKTTSIDYSKTTSIESEGDSENSEPPVLTHTENVEPESEPATNNPPVNPPSQSGNTDKPKGVAEGKSSAAPPNFEIEAKQWLCHAAPWHESISTYRDEMLEAVFQGDRPYYGLENGKRNKRRIEAHLQKLERQSIEYGGHPDLHRDMLALQSRQALLSYWELGQAIATARTKAAQQQAQQQPVGEFGPPPPHVLEQLKKLGKRYAS